LVSPVSIVSFLFKQNLIRFKGENKLGPSSGKLRLRVYEVVSKAAGVASKDMKLHFNRQIHGLKMKV
jgi:hypothetical protein